MLSMADPYTSLYNICTISEKGVARLRFNKTTAIDTDDFRESAWLHGGFGLSAGDVA